MYENKTIQIKERRTMKKYWPLFSLIMVAFLEALSIELGRNLLTLHSYIRFLYRNIHKSGQYAEPQEKITVLIFHSPHTYTNGMSSEAEYSSGSSS